MDITRENFNELYPLLKEKISTCTFMSFDEEMTGIHSSDPANKYCKDDIPSQRYQKMCPIASKYSIIQFGLCFFHPSPTGDGFVASPFNFYLFPDSGPDISVSVSSIDFLRKNHMDFGKWIGEGVPFVDSRGEEWLKKKYLIVDPVTAVPSNSVDTKKSSSITLTRQSDLTFMETNFNLFHEFLTNSNETIFEFQDCNSYLRRYIYQQIETSHADEVIIKKSDTSARLCAYKINKESKRQHDIEQKLQREKDYYSALGFRRLFHDLVEAKKPIVGHNNWFDVLFLSRWLDGPLVNDFEIYRKQIHSQFPMIFDTKYIETCGLLPVIGGAGGQDSYLEQCYQKYLQANTNKDSKLSITIHSDCSSFDPTSAHYHNAGYDAYCTGYVFANQIYHPDGTFQTSSLAASASASIYELVQNKLFVMFSLFHLNLSPKENESSTLSKYLHNQEILRVTNFPKSVTTELILGIETVEGTGESVGEEGEKKENLEVMWIDDFSFFIIFPPVGEEEGKQRSTRYQSLAPEEWKFETLAEFISSKEQKVEAKDEEDQEEEIDVVTDSPVRAESSFISKAVNAMMSPFRWAANTDADDDTDSSNRKSKRTRVE